MFLYLCERLVRFWRSQQKVVITKVCVDVTFNTGQNIINFSKWCSKASGSYAADNVISERNVPFAIVVLTSNF